ncbi:hypothetical protein F2Q68_00000870 [Brassica cretica]|uniref:Uncharacterized protein n=1 Tax=Brassica cretica TaxID=69181 RepID=A0A8S9JJ07_BRACR|nr:hypothetical protein F2Q68_00000870 [Brassica cretica]
MEESEQIDVIMMMAMADPPDLPLSPTIRGVSTEEAQVSDRVTMSGLGSTGISTPTKDVDTRRQQNTAVCSLQSLSAPGREGCGYEGCGYEEKRSGADSSDQT